MAVVYIEYIVQVELWYGIVYNDSSIYGITIFVHFLYYLAFSQMCERHLGLFISLNFSSSDLDL